MATQANTKRQAGRPRTGNTKKNESVSLSIGLAKKVKKFAAQNGMSFSGFIEQAIRTKFEAMTSAQSQQAPSTPA